MTALALRLTQAIALVALEDPAASMGTEPLFSCPCALLEQLQTDMAMDGVEWRPGTIVHPPLPILPLIAVAGLAQAPCVVALDLFAVFTASIHLTPTMPWLNSRAMVRIKAKVHISSFCCLVSFPCRPS